MKKLLLMLFFIPFISLAQEYSEVIEMTGQTGDQLYSKANEWFALTFKSANDVIQLKDPVERKIIGKGIKQFSYPIGKMLVAMDMNFTLMVQFKDSKYKYNISSSEIKPIETNAYVGSQTYTYELYKQMSNTEGVTEYFKSTNTPSWMVGKKGIQLIVDGNKAAVIEIEIQLHKIIDDLTMTLKKEENKDNW